MLERSLRRNILSRCRLIARPCVSGECAVDWDVVTFARCPFRVGSLPGDRGCLTRPCVSPLWRTGAINPGTSLGRLSMWTPLQSCLSHGKLWLTDFSKWDMRREVLLSGASLKTFFGDGFFVVPSDGESKNVIIAVRIPIFVMGVHSHRIDRSLKVWIDATKQVGLGAICNAAGNVKRVVPRQEEHYRLTYSLNGEEFKQCSSSLPEPGVTGGWLDGVKCLI